jgi:hypothetical protein
MMIKYVLAPKVTGIHYTAKDFLLMLADGLNKSA